MKSTSDTRAKPARPVEVRAKRTRDLILRAGLDAILHGGIHGFTANELMRRTGLSKGALFHHFDSLDDVAIECVRMGDHLFTCEAKGSPRETLEFMMRSLHGHRRMRALAALLYFFCEKARDEARFKKAMNFLNDTRLRRLTEMFNEVLPKPRSAAALEPAVLYLHNCQMGLAGPSGDCMGAPQRLRAWDTVVESTLRLLDAK